MREQLNIAITAPANNNLMSGGVYSYARKLAEALSLRGHSLTVYFPAKKFPKNIRTYGRVRVRHYSSRIELISLLKSNEHEIVHFLSLPHTLFPFWALSQKTKSIITLFADEPRNLLSRWSLRAAGLILVHSVGLAKTYSQRWGIEATVINSFIAKPKALMPDGIKRYDLSTGEYFLSNIDAVPKRDIVSLISAHEKAVVRKRLVLIGERKDVSDIILKAGKNIIALSPGNKTLVSELLTNAYTYVHPARHVVEEKSVLTAMSFGVPVLVSNAFVGDIVSDIISKYAFFFRTDRADSLTKQISRLEQRARLTYADAEYIQNRVMDEYGLDSHITTLEQLYHPTKEKRHSFVRYQSEQATSF